MTTPSVFRWYGTFADSKVESDYRNHCIESDRGLVRAVCSIVVVAAFGFVINDFRNANPESSVWWLLVVGRVTVVTIAMATIVLLSRIRSFRILDLVAVIIVASVTLNSLWADASRARDFYTHVGADVLILIGIYFAIPMAQRLRLLFAALYSIGLAYLCFFYKEPPDNLTTTSVIVSLTVANMLGLLISLRVARIQRAEFIALTNEKEAREALEAAEKEIQSLTGLIPICANCKSVRNDDGFWEQVETYVRARTQAEFSHSLCPECVTVFEPKR